MCMYVETNIQKSVTQLTEKSSWGNRISFSLGNIRSRIYPELYLDLELYWYPNRWYSSTFRLFQLDLCIEWGWMNESQELWSLWSRISDVQLCDLKRRTFLSLLRKIPTFNCMISNVVHFYRFYGKYRRSTVWSLTSCISIVFTENTDVQLCDL